MRFRLLVYCCIIVLLVVLVGYSIRTVDTFKSVDGDEIDSIQNDTLVTIEVGMTLGECLDSKGVKIYGKTICPYCNTQKNSLGEDYDEIPFIHCDDYKTECNKMGIRGYPTWIINGKKYPGQRTRENLAFLAGCEKYV